MRGRPRKPKDVKIFQGNPSKEDLSYEEPTADGTPKRPKGLGRFGRYHWELVLPQAMKWGAGAVDTAALKTLCQWWEVMQQAFKAGDVNTAFKATSQWVKLAAKFGLSPADRAQMRTDPARKQDDLQKFIASK